MDDGAIVQVPVTLRDLERHPARGTALEQEIALLHGKALELETLFQLYRMLADVTSHVVGIIRYLLIFQVVVPAVDCLPRAQHLAADQQQ